jgi:tRNA(fMet)-specific endonuclease VapC
LSPRHQFVIGLFANESSIKEKIKSFFGNIFIPSIVLGELFYGAEQSTRKDYNRRKIEELAEASLVLEAALADQHQLILVTRDKYFNSVETISIEIEAW